MSNSGGTNNDSYRPRGGGATRGGTYQKKETNQASKTNYVA